MIYYFLTKVSNRPMKEAKDDAKLIEEMNFPRTALKEVMEHLQATPVAEETSFPMTVLNPGVEHLQVTPAAAMNVPQRTAKVPWLQCYTAAKMEQCDMMS